MEAMKMETRVVATRAGKVRLVATVGSFVEAGALIISFE